MNVSLRLAFAILFVALCCAAVFAQTLTTARIVGTVTDVQGAAVVDAKVAAEDIATGELRKAATDASGDYVLASLSPGTYKITVAALGFSTALFSDVRAGI